MSDAFPLEESLEIVSRASCEDLNRAGHVYQNCQRESPRKNHQRATNLKAKENMLI